MSKSVETVQASPLQQAEAEYHGVIERTKGERQEARSRRQRAYQVEIEAGRSYREIASEIGIHHSRVEQVVKGRNR